VPQDQVVARYLPAAFAWAPMGAVAGVAILAASMSTLDGLLVALSASLAGDLFPGRAARPAVSRAVLAALAALTIAWALSPPELALILGQLGVYGLVVAGAGPLVVGLFWDGPLRPGWAACSAIAALATHFGLSLSGLTANPGVSACAALIAGAPFALAAGPLYKRGRVGHNGPVPKGQELSTRAAPR